MFTVWKEGRVAHVRLNPMKAFSVGVGALSHFQHRAKTKQMPPVLFSLLNGIFTPLVENVTVTAQHQIDDQVGQVDKVGQVNQAQSLVNLSS